ncbi:MAG: TonB-dependent receptor [Flavobacteriaceae bacterium CG_4_8_14_3_um_filter_34_10]|nr:TonB-dependent receptor [Flavobacteriia bacterium]OIP50211.1 MAG: TonB-dependent receptor [Flavobacteriaceae bacterium CG2_30_34_30]PIQ19048.1 MAG: TonB-dependent receptor [Flavobacteriaceae bacterium CG18_big_fil_WC_8_21_14_2_50_34_36]PIV49363.1 MAG: TonB-dependent receptor [Flavobacteriaceae bacterium CG02_land_8_20_14_3_00_34_13]PIX09818.1 MAG: TonB-dependent receptor [Flavobacteriaceae bacterium CG_4_8_14_3_um_filter_34_10]PIZ09024.1 MAG: TonB-dependent receptor [Flavobacteriaceae bacte
MKKTLLFLICIILPGFLFAQVVSGTITDISGTALSGVNVIEKGTSNGTITDFSGNYTIQVNENATLVFSYVGFETLEEKVDGRTNLSVTLQDGMQLGEIQLVGTRSPKRTAIDTPVAIDVIDVREVSTQTGRIELNELLQYAAPSFNANKQSGSDGADHIDPATLRGLGPDQTLVLVNGKRRHQSSLVNIFGTRGRGNTGTDLNAIPAAALKRIEILRDGASAQYGSDAIAGVINLVLNDKIDVFSANINYGFFNTDADGDFPAGTPNTDGNRLDTNRDGNAIGKDKDFDGGSVKVTANYGVGIGENGFANFTTEYISKNKTLRPGFDFRRGMGEAAIDGFNFFGNLSMPISDKADFYAFGGRNYRDTDAFAFTRNNPTERNVISIYPNGFTPRITSIITDNSVTAGFRTKNESGWKIDISNSYGINNFHYFIKGTLNASLEEVSPTDFDAGGHSLSQNTTNVDFSKYYDSILEGFNLAIGAEYRTENFIIFAGEEGSYGTYDTNGILIVDPTTQTQPTDSITGELRPGGSQGFPGYSPANEVDRNRSNISLYVDGELEVTDKLLIAVAGRFEDYSDFGSTINGKFAARYKATENINVRGSVSSGFRAPSLAQLYYNLRFTNFVGGQGLETQLSPNNSPVTASFGIGPLKEETAFNASLGFTANFGSFTATVDGYFIDVTNRIVLTGNFDAPQIPNVEAAQFFANGANTETTGLDIVLSHRAKIGNGTLTSSFIGNINNMTITDVKNGSLDEQTFFGERDKAFLLASAPDSKLTLNLKYDIKWFDAALGLTRFSEVTLLDFQMFEDVADYGSFANQVAAASDIYSEKYVTDLNLGFKLNENMKLNIGSNNLFNIYPDQQDDWSEGGGYWDSVQMGFGGAYYYAKLNLNF